jgi:probable phosphoglycerate mutase
VTRAVKIYLARHAQSLWQLAPSQDWDTALSEVGHAQAQRLGDWLAQHGLVDRHTPIDIAALCASPSRRAIETATYVAESLGIALSVDSRLTEADFHVADHLPTSRSPLEPPLGASASDRYLAFKEQSKRALQGLVDKAEIHGGAVFAITHGGLIKTMLRLAGGSDALSFRLCNTGITLIEWHCGRWQLVYLNRWDHLPVDMRTF